MNPACFWKCLPMLYHATSCNLNSRCREWPCYVVYDVMSHSDTEPQINQLCLDLRPLNAMNVSISMNMWDCLFLQSITINEKECVKVFPHCHTSVCIKLVYWYLNCIRIFDLKSVIWVTEIFHLKRSVNESWLGIRTEFQ